MNVQARTPYDGLPDTAYWRRSVASLPREAVDPCSVPPFQISSSDKVMSAGSCFAQHISRYLRESGFTSMLTEPPHPLLPDETAAAFNYGTFTARYGNIYVPRQLLQLFQRVYAQFHPKEDLWVSGHGFIDPFRPQIQHGGFSTRKEFDLDRQQHFSAVRQAFETLDVFVFTFGLTEAWLSREDGAVFPLCPGVVGGEFDTERHYFHNFSVEEIVADAEAFFEGLRGVNPKSRIIVTVSPVPLIATASGKHVLSATTYSKSVLRVACEMLERRVEALYYFPSYEIIMGPQGRGAYLADDLRSVRETGVDQVMRVFFERLAATDYGSLYRPDPSGPGQDERQDLDDAMQTACDEEVLDRLRRS